jgi:chromosome segregation ATPase
MTDPETPIGTIRERLSGLLADWGEDFSSLLTELEEKRARLDKLETDTVDNTQKFESLSRQVEAQDTLIESLNLDADEATALRQEIHDRDLELEKKSAEIGSKQELISALRQDTEGIGRLKGDGRVKDQEIARLMIEKGQAEQHAAELTAEFNILTASTLTGIDTAAELEAVRAELEARKSVIESLRGDAGRAQALEAQLEEKRDVIAKLEVSVDRHAGSIAELQQTIASWRAKYAALKTQVPSTASITSRVPPGLTGDELQSLDCAEDVSGDLIDATVSVDMRKSLLTAQQAHGNKITTNR